MLHLTRANSKRKGAKSTVRGRVAITADDSGPRKREALLWSNDVDNALALVTKTEVGETKFFDVILKSQALRS